MKKKKSTHPKLYFDVIYKEKNVLLTFISNKFDVYGKRLLEEEVLENNININKNKYLVNINTVQFNLLKKYIEIQKRVLVKHQKDGNYDSVRIMNYSLKTMKQFQQVFEKWFDENKL